MLPLFSAIQNPRRLREFTRLIVSRGVSRHYNGPDSHHLVLLQGYTLGSQFLRWSNRPKPDCGGSQSTAARRIRPSAKHSSSEPPNGPAETDFETLLAALDPDPRDSLNGVRDMPNQLLCWGLFISVTKRAARRLGSCAVLLEPQFPARSPPRGLRFR